MNVWLLLGGAIVAEVIATSSLKATEGFTKLWPTLIVIAGYGAAFQLLSQTLNTIPVGVAYAIWSGLGVVLIALVAWILYGQKLDAPALLGMLLIVAGVVIMNMFSKSMPR